MSSLPTQSASDASTGFTIKIGATAGGVSTSYAFVTHNLIKASALQVNRRTPSMTSYAVDYGTKTFGSSFNLDTVYNGQTVDVTWLIASYSSSSTGYNIAYLDPNSFTAGYSGSYNAGAAKTVTVNTANASNYNLSTNDTPIVATNLLWK